MRIKSAEVRRIEVPYGTEGFEPSWLPGVRQKTYSQTLVRLFSNNGHVGIASTNCFDDEVYEYTRDVLPLLLARELNEDYDVDKSWKSVEEATDSDDTSSMLRTVLAGATTSSANRQVNWTTILKNLLIEPSKIPRMFDKNIELNHCPWFLNVALWDLFAKSQNRSVAECLGKQREEVSAYASTGEVVTSRMTSFLETCLSDGYGGIKLRIKDSDSDGEQMKRVQTIVETAPDSFQVGVDANEGWSLLPPYWSYDEAEDVGLKLQEWGVDWFEEPLGCLRLDQLEKLRRELGIEIVGGELEGGLSRQREILSAYDTINPDVCMTVGFTQGLQLAEEADRYGVGMTPHTWGLGPSLAAGLQLACCLPECDRLEVPHDPAWPPAYRDAILEAPLEVSEGTMSLPDEPGLGITLDQDSLNDFTVKKDLIGPPVT